jgi:acetoacetate decarboxylase
LTPNGLSSLVRSPPWHFSGEVLAVLYRIEPAAAKAFLPDIDGLGSDQGVAAAIFGDWQSCCSDGAELDDPITAQYKECYIALGCRLAGRPVVRVAFTWVDRDFSLVRGLVQGYPKKLGSIAMTRAMNIGRATAPVEDGGRFSASLAAGDRRRIDARVILREPADAPYLVTAPLIHTRHFPSWDPAREPLTEHVLSTSVDQAIEQVWSGDATLSFADVPNDELSLLAPHTVISGYRLLFGETLIGGRVIS